MRIVKNILLVALLFIAAIYACAYTVRSTQYTTLGCDLYAEYNPAPDVQNGAYLVSENINANGLLVCKYRAHR